MFGCGGGCTRNVPPATVLYGANCPTLSPTACWIASLLVPVARVKTISPATMNKAPIVMPALPMISSFRVLAGSEDEKRTPPVALACFFPVWYRNP